MNGLKMRNAMREIIEDAQGGEEVIISLKLTSACNFACDHCLYSCGKQRNPKYMQDEILRKVHRQIMTLKEIGVTPSLNIIGGEPTLDMNEFARVMEWAYDMMRKEYVHVHVVTNGWWIDDPGALYKMIEIMSRAPELGIENNGLTVDISRDQWHAKFQESDDPRAKLARILDSPGEYAIDGYIDFPNGDLIWICPECGEEYEQGEMCEECDCEPFPELRYDAYEMIKDISPEGDFREWFIMDHFTSEKGVIPTGRGANVSTDQHYTRCGGGKIDALVITFESNGKVSDMCCAGSMLPVGDVNDHPLALLTAAQLFVQDQRPDCWTCKEKSIPYARAMKRNGTMRALNALAEKMTKEMTDD